jgi:hypothetical protein
MDFIYILRKSDVIFNQNKLIKIINNKIHVVSLPLLILINTRNKRIDWRY